MRQIILPVVGTVAAWKAEVRALAAQGVPPEAVQWSLGEARHDLFARAPASEPSVGGTPSGQPSAGGAPVTLRLTPAAAEGLEAAMQHRDPQRFGLGHAAVIALSRRQLWWGDRSDPTMARLMAMEKTVRRAIHKMHAFVRFRELPPVQTGRRRFAAWFEPEHPVAEAAAPFFARRFGDMDWAIATPTVTLIFDGALRVEATRAPPARVADATEDLWRTYFAAIFNPARLNPRMMQSEMPAFYWKNLPEADLIPDLIRNAPAAVAAMHARALSEAPAAYQARAAVARARLAPPATGSLAALAEAARACTRCALHGPATQTVWGEGPSDAALMIVGEAPGDLEDLSGRPFQGPAGALLEELLAELGARREALYLTNAVKHVSFRPMGRKRLHQQPGADHLEHCRGWLDHERQLVRPRVILALGTVALRAVSGQTGTVATLRGQMTTLPDGCGLIASFHPASVLRLKDLARQSAARAALRDDLAMALRASAGGRQPPPVTGR